MRREIDSEECLEIHEEGDGFFELERRRVSFIVRSKIRKLVGNRKLGVAWLVLDLL